MNSTDQDPEGLVLLLHPDDNIVIAATSLAAGTIVDISGQPVTLSRDIVLGHKLARTALAAGDQVLRYGAPIGTMRSAVELGGHVHSHNLDSDYLPATSRDVVQPKKDGE